MKFLKKIVSRAHLESAPITGSCFSKINGKNVDLIFLEKNHNKLVLINLKMLHKFYKNTIK